MNFKEFKPFMNIAIIGYVLIVAINQLAEVVAQLIQLLLSNLNLLSEIIIYQNLVSNIVSMIIWMFLIGFSWNQLGMEPIEIRKYRKIFITISVIAVASFLINLILNYLNNQIAQENFDTIKHSKIEDLQLVSYVASGINFIKFIVILTGFFRLIYGRQHSND